MLRINIQQPLGELSLAIRTEIANHGVTAIFGRSGAGKSSLINLIAGLSTAQHGEISLNGRILFNAQQHINLPPEQRRVGYVFQEPRLFPHYRVEGNLRYGCKRCDDAQFLQIVELLGIRPLLNRLPNSLSGGEKQRVAIGRALLTNPDILLMDEPLSALDRPRKEELLDYLSHLAKQVKIPILYVSHSLDEVVRLADQLILLEQGKIIAQGRTVEVWQSPAFAPWQPHSQRISLLELPIVATQPQYHMIGLALGEQRLWVSCPRHAPLGETRRVTIASREVAVSKIAAHQSSIRNQLQGQICNIIAQNDRVDLAILVADHPIWATISPWALDELKLQVGQQIYLQIKAVSLSPP